MSLINNLLKDLDQRKSVDRPLAPISLISQKPKKHYFNLFNKIPFVIFSLVLLCGIFLLFPHHQTIPTPVAFSPENPSAASLTNPEDSIWLKPNTLLGVTLQTKENLTELSFLLKNPSLYRVAAHPSKNQLLITFENAQLESALPPLDGLNTALKKLSAEQIQHHLLFTLTFKPNASIENIHFINENNKPELVLNVKYINEEINAPASTVKTTAMQSLLLEQYQNALTEAEHNKIDLAIKHLTSLLAIDPNLSDVRVSLAALMLDNGRKKTAAKIIDAGLQIDSHHIQLIELKARLLTFAGKVNNALSLLLTDPPAISDYPDYHAMIAALYERTNNNRLASNLYRKLLVINPENGNWWCGLGIALEKQGQSAKAKAAYNKAITAGNLNAETIAYLQNRLQIRDGVANAQE